MSDFHSRSPRSRWLRRNALVTISRGGKITDVNEATEKVAGVFRNVLIGSDFSDCFTEPKRREYEDVLGAVLGNLKTAMEETG